MAQKKTALLFIDIQENMLSTPGGWHVPERVQKTFLPAAEAVLKRAREAKIPVFHVQHHSKDEADIDAYGKPGWELRFPPLVAQGEGEGQEKEEVYHKTVKNVFQENPDLEATLQGAGVGRLLVAGLQSEMCVQAASEAALAEGFEVVLLSGAHATMEEGEEGTPTAEEISAKVESELEAKGAKVIKYDAEWF